MDDFEQRFAASLKQAARRASEGSVPAPTTHTSRPSRRDRLVIPMVAAATVVAIVGVGGWVAGSGGPETVPGQPASAGPAADYPSESTDAPLASRAAVIKVAEKLTVFRSEPGFGKIAVDYETATVTVFWVGTPPVAVSSMGGTGPDGVTIALKSAILSEADLLDAGTAVLRAGRERFGQAAIAEVHPNHELSGLIVKATTPRVTAQALADTSKGVPVTVRLIDTAQVTCSYGQGCQVQNDN